jgi:tryptophan synthase beta chain
MVRCSYEQKPYRGILIRAYGAEVFPSPSDRTHFGRHMIASDPQCSGSLGVAISEAIEDAANREDTKYALGSVLNHVVLHQTVMGLETQRQLEQAGEKADILIGCVGGGSNFAGLILPFVPAKLAGQNMKFLAVEPHACPTLTRGQYRYDYGDVARLTPLLKMHTLGHKFFPPPIHAGGLRYHGESPILSHLAKLGIVEAKAYYQTEVFEAAKLFLNTEGFLPAPETSHAIRAAIDAAREAEPGTVIVFLYSGHGFLDLGAYENYLRGELKNEEYTEEQLQSAMQSCPDVDC